jgi:hypothetical protein
MPQLFRKTIDSLTIFLFLLDVVCYHNLLGSMWVPAPTHVDVSKEPRLLVAAVFFVG